ncbi:MAG: ATP-dependent helicase, partial [Fusobacteriaceae bacterium]
LITLEHCQDGRGEAEFVVDKIIELKSSGKSYSDFTILYRTNAQSRNFEETFMRNGIPYKVFGGQQFYQRAEIKDILAYLNLVNNSKDGISLRRVINIPKRKIGEVTFEKVITHGIEKNISPFDVIKNISEVRGIGQAVSQAFQEFYKLIEELIKLSEEHSKVSKIFETLIVKLKYEDYLCETYGKDEGESRIQNIDELRTSIYELEKMVDGNLTLQEYLENVSLVSATDDLQEHSEYVKLMTIHNSKGLEFPVVFLTGVEDEIFPGKDADFNPDTIEEERRLCYVAVTRAEERLFLSYADARYMYGEMVFRSKSRFIEEIPHELLFEEKIEERKVEFIKKYNQPVEGFGNLDNLNITSSKLDSSKGFMFKSGEKVFHRKFGLGIVRAMDEKKVIVEFIDGKREIASVLAEKFLVKQ